jgi:ATP-dependent Clp protease ATP-binding subunit ClpA
MRAAFWECMACVVLSTEEGLVCLCLGTGGAVTEATKALVMAVVHKHFRPEFLNRLDEVVTFEALARGQLRHVARLQAEDINERLKSRSIQLVRFSLTFLTVLNTRRAAQH